MRRAIMVGLMLCWAGVFAAFAATGDPPTGPTARLLAAPGDTFKIELTWQPSQNAAGQPADSFVVSYTYHKYPMSAAFPTPGPTRRFGARLKDTVIFAAPPYSDSLRVVATVQAKIGTYVSPAVSGFKFFRRPDPTPSAPGPVVLDTIP